MIRVTSQRKNGTAPRANELIMFISRPSPLGNPFHMEFETQRDTVINQYKVWLHEEYKKHGPVYAALQRIIQAERNNEQIALVCWCAPLACHGDVIKDAVEAIIAKNR